MAGIVIRPRARILHGHDWVYASEVLKVFGEPADGDIISIRDGRDRFLGSAIYNGRSQIVARRFCRRRQDLDVDFFHRRILAAVEVRTRRGCNPLANRLVWSEADGLPGVVADRYGDVIVLQTLTVGMEQRKSLLVEALASLGGVRTIVERNDAPVRATEGLPLLTGLLHGPEPGLREVDIHDVRFQVDFLGGHKTGLYLDQVDNYDVVSGFAAGRTVLDCFSNQGGFALACGRRGATELTAVESSVESVARLQVNASANGLQVTTHAENVFEFLKEAERRGAKYDMVILDPPSFTKARGRINDALRGYREIHVRAASLLSPGGLLATFCCSHHVPSAEFEQSIAEGFADARCTGRIVRRMTQSADHPVLLHMPETGYLKGFLIESMPGR